MKRALIPVLALFASIAAAQEPQDHDDHGVVEKRPFPKLTLRVKVTEEKTSDGELMRYVNGEGESGYPDGVILVMELRLADAVGYLPEKAAARSLGGRWSMRSQALGRMIYKGRYVVRLGFDPELQQRGMTAGINPELDPGIQYVQAEVQIGTPEEAAAERADVEQFYVRAYGKSREMIEKVIAEYEKQRKELDKKRWNDFFNDASDRFVVIDAELENYRLLRNNILEIAIYEDIALINATATGPLYTVLSDAVGINGTPTAQQITAAEEMIKSIKDTLGRLDAALGGVKPDPAWKKPEPPPPPKLEHSAPPGISIDPATPTADPSRAPEPKRRGMAPRFGFVEAGILLAVLCGIAALAVLLKKK